MVQNYGYLSVLICPWGFKSRIFFCKHYGVRGPEITKKHYPLPKSTHMPYIASNIKLMQWVTG